MVCPLYCHCNTTSLTIYLADTPDEEDMAGLEEDLIAVLQVLLSPHRAISYSQSPNRALSRNPQTSPLSLSPSRQTLYVRSIVLFHAFEYLYIPVDTSVVFWSPSVKIGEAAAFQVLLTAPTSISISSLPFSLLAIYLDGDGSPVTIRHSPEKQQNASSVQWVNIGDVKSQVLVEAEANLRWDFGGVLVVSATMSSSVPMVLKVDKLL